MARTVGGEGGERSDLDVMSESSQRTRKTGCQKTQGREGGETRRLRFLSPSSEPQRFLRDRLSLLTLPRKRKNCIDPVRKKTNGRDPSHP